MKLLKNLSIACALIITITAPLFGMRSGGGRYFGGGRSLSGGSQTNKSPYQQWVKQGADVSTLSYDQVLKFVRAAMTYGRGTEQESSTRFKNLLSRVNKDDYEKIFTNDIIHANLASVGVSNLDEKDMLEKFKILIKKLVESNDTILIQRIQDEINEMVIIKERFAQSLKHSGPQNIADIYNKEFESLKQAKDILEQTLAQAQREQRQKSIFLKTAPKGDTHFTFK